MRIYTYNFKIICRNKLFLLSYIFTFGFLTVSLLAGLYSAIQTTEKIFIFDIAYDSFKRTTRLVSYYLPIVLFTALYVFNINKQNYVDELIFYIAPKRDGRAKRQVLITWNFFTYLLVLGINLFAYSISDFSTSIQFLMQIILYITVNYFILGILMITIAFAISLIKKIQYQILLAGFSLCVFGGYFKDFLFERMLNKELFYRLYAFVQIVTPGGKDWALQTYVGETVQLHQLGVILFWGTISSLVTAVVFRNKKGHLIGSLLIALFILVLPYEEMGQSFYGGLGSGYAWYHYYDKFGERNIEGQEQEPQFAVTNYEMDLWTVTCLKAEVTACVNENDLDKYEFTLYHPYKILHIKDQDGEKLRFTRDGDYVTVYPIRGKALNNIKFAYYGNGKGFYSQLEGINLVPGMFFYPMPGFHKVYEESTEGIREFVPNYLLNEAEFHVKVHSPLTVYSTLNQKERNVFTGKSDTIGIFAGLFMQKTVVDDVTFIHSQIEQYKFSGFESYADAVEYADLISEKDGLESLSFHNKTVIVLPDDAYGLPYVHDNYLLFGDMVTIYGLDYLADKCMEDVNEQLDKE